MEMLPIALFWFLAFWGIYSRGYRVLLYLFFATIPFGAMAVLPVAVTGGLTIIPTSMVALILIARVLGTEKGFHFALSSAAKPRRLMLLFLFWVLALFSVLFFPRLFAGQIDVVPMRGILSETALLRPSKQNISQFGYLSISIFSVVVFAYILRGYATRQIALRGLCLGAVVLIATGLLDFASQYVPLGPLLAPFRTATYSLLTDVSVFDSKRVVGLMPEASAYGGLCVAFLCAIYFLRRAIPESSVKDTHLLLLTAGLALFTWLSKSSASMAALVIFGGLVFAEWCWRSTRSRRQAPERRQMRRDARIAYAMVVALLVVGVAAPVIFDPIVMLFERMVLEKSGSDSFEERGFWRQVAWDAALASYGIGVGVGSTRASSSIISVVSHTGFLGAALFYGFVLQSLLRRSNRQHADAEQILIAFRFAYLPPLVIGSLVGGINFGVFNAFLFGLVAAVSQPFQTRQSALPSPTPNVRLRMENHAAHARRL